MILDRWSRQVAGWACALTLRDRPAQGRQDQGDCESGGRGGYALAGMQRIFACEPSPEEYNGATCKSQHLGIVCANLGIRLLQATHLLGQLITVRFDPIGYKRLEV